MSEKKSHPFFARLASIGKSICLCFGFKPRQKYNPDESPVVKLVNFILQDAIKKGASEIHFEPLEKTFEIRYKIQDDIFTTMIPPFKLKNAMIERIKVLTGFDLFEHEKPRQGWLDFNDSDTGEKFLFMVTAIPTRFGEKIILKPQR